MRFFFSMAEIITCEKWYIAAVTLEKAFKWFKTQICRNNIKYFVRTVSNLERKTNMDLDYLTVFI